MSSLEHPSQAQATQKENTMNGKCECCDQQGVLERFPAPVGISEIMMCEACRNGDALDRYMEFVMVPTGTIRKTGRRRRGKNIYESLICQKN
jgi:hypothetical protein